MHVLMPCDFDHAPFRRKIAVQDDQPAGRLERSVERSHNFLLGSFSRCLRFLSDRLAANR